MKPNDPLTNQGRIHIVQFCVTVHAQASLSWGPHVTRPVQRIDQVTNRAHKGPRPEVCCFNNSSLLRAQTCLCVQTIQRVRHFIGWIPVVPRKLPSRVSETITTLSRSHQSFKVCQKNGEKLFDRFFLISSIPRQHHEPKSSVHRT